jgi:hypothetical protein
VRHPFHRFQVDDAATAVAGHRDAAEVEDLGGGTVQGHGRRDQRLGLAGAAEGADREQRQRRRN